MPQSPVNVGTNPNDGTGDSLRTAFLKLNANDADHETRVKAMEIIIAATIQNPTVQKALLTAIVSGLPTTLPNQPDQLWRNGQILAIS